MKKILSFTIALLLLLIPVQATAEGLLEDTTVTPVTSPVTPQILPNNLCGLKLSADQEYLLVSETMQPKALL